MAFRDDGVASKARAESLEQRVEELEAENAQLRTRRAAQPSHRVAWVLLGLSLLLAAAAFWMGFGVSGYVGEQTGIVLGVLAVLAVHGALLWLLVATLLEVVSPNELLVISGRRVEGGRGYRLIRGGRALRVPLLERAERMDLSPFRVELSLRFVHAKRERVSDLSAWARVRLDGSEPGVHRAVERFLGRTKDEIRVVAQETLEGVVRDVISGLSIEELDEDAKVHASLRHSGEEALASIGLELEDLRLVRDA